MNQFSKEIKWIKKNRKYILFWGIFIFVLIPKFIFIIVKDGEHLGFLGGYVGAILTLGGVWFQIQRLEKHRKEEENEREKEKKRNERNRKLGVLKYLKFVLKENVKGAEKNDCARNMQLNLLYLTSWDSYKEESKVFSKFKNQFIDNNLNVIMELDKDIGEDILKMERLLVDTLEDYNYLLKNKKRRKVLFESLKGDEKLKVKDIEIYDMVRSKEGEIPSDKIEKEMKKLIEGIGEKLLGSQREEKWGEMWKYHLLDINLNGKGFKIIEKSEKVLKKIEVELENI
ncbi:MULTISPECIES: hypothetical protein [Psychrilyobacter]|uniref:Uncharacterized protein n=1 Tax=Psychrilyobacter piezotolerans TaxID=2293438 RepID=A0ABX9KH07_9FUSO|nr:MULTISPECIES: hypothetical protein [Psychrilyobacter]MCS5423101.1 hypothetical protein [Psychrilyobacter sp. S5]NDI77903.1 hypothetical protein [Psychrilyobacter piezotolerans]RDE62021.1 hypothetical protein DV867_07475 [Psychrilyobacter sp. S5]REI41268.1 hypothetical protein DYH56_07475 [Psychrilyobacter piezotolerans]